MTEEKETKKVKVLRLKELHPDLTGKAIAELAGCTPAYVSILTNKKKPNESPAGS